MRVVHVIFNMQLGGAETMLIDIMSHQVNLGYDVNLLIINRGYNKDLVSKINPAIKISYVSRPEGSRNIYYVLKLNNLLRRIRPNVVHVHNDKALGLILKSKHVKYVITVHDTRINLRYFKRANEVCAISNAVKNDIYNRYGINATLVYNGIDIHQVISNENQTLCNVVKILQIGRLVHEKKGQDILLKAVSKLIQKGITNISVDFIGEGVSLNYLQQLAITLGLDVKVNFLGPKSREYIYSHIKEYNILAQPSIYEGFGLTVVEGMAAKIPVLVTRNEGPLEIIANGKYGEVFDVNDIDDCALKIERMIHNYARYKYIAETEAYKYIKENFDLTKTVNEYDLVYGKV